MFLLKELSLGILLSWLLLLYVGPNEGGVVDRQYSDSLEHVRRISQQMNAIRNQVQKNGVAWSRLAELGVHFDSDTEDESSESDEAHAEDPEVRPHLFQGDIAIDLEMYKNWRVGLSWDAFPERKWPNRTVPYVISPLYEPDDQVKEYFMAAPKVNYTLICEFYSFSTLDCYLQCHSSTGLYVVC